MKTPRLKPLLYVDECEQHGKTNFIVEQQNFDFKKKKVTFVFYCKKCWNMYGQECPAWQTSMTIDEYNDYFGFNTGADN